MLEVIAAAVISGAISAVGTIAALKVELKWILREVNRAHARLDRLRAPDVAPVEELGI